MKPGPSFNRRVFPPPTAPPPGPGARVLCPYPLPKSFLRSGRFFGPTKGNSPFPPWSARDCIKRNDGKTSKFAPQGPAAFLRRKAHLLLRKAPTCFCSTHPAPVAKCPREFSLFFPHSPFPSGQSQHSRFDPRLVPPPVPRAVNFFFPWVAWAGPYPPPWDEGKNEDRRSPFKSGAGLPSTAALGGESVITPAPLQRSN